MEESGVFHKANEVIELYGEHAATISGMRAKGAADRGNVQKFHFRNRVMDGTNDIQRMAPASP
jgi:hypothetical protein